MKFNAFFLCFVIGVGAFGGAWAQQRKIPDETRRTCDEQGIQKFGRITNFNNVWGTFPKNDPIKGYSQCLQTDVAGGKLVTQFEWSDFDIGKGRVKSYPHLTIGWDWNGAYTEQSELPFRVADRRSLITQYDVETSSVGRNNLSYDIWLSRRENPTSKDLTHEVMIWVDTRNMIINRKRDDVVEIGDNVYDFYFGDTSLGGWKYISFVARDSRLKGQIRLNDFFNYLRKRNIMRGDELVNGVSFGNEVVQGSGKTKVLDFDLRIEE